MNIDDLIFYILDIFIFILLLRMLKNSREIILEVKVTGKWIIPVLFIGVSVLSFIRYEGVFRYAQSALLILFAGMYYCMRSGFSEKGIVSMGSLTKYEKAGKVTLSTRDHCVYYGPARRQAALYFAPEQQKEIREFLKARSVKPKQTA